MKPYALFLLTMLLNSTLGEKQIISKDVQMCEDVKTSSKAYGTVTNNNGVQYFDGNLTLTEPFGNNLKVFLDFSVSQDGKTFKPAFKLSERFCTLLKVYLGPLAWEAQRAAQMIPGACPIHKGTYHIKKFAIDFRKMFIKETLPVGTLRVRGEIVEIKTQRICLCINSEIEVRSV